MKTFAMFGLLFLALLLTVAADAQIICGTMGAFTSCDGPRGSYTIQTDLGNGQGVIMDHKGNMEPYAIMPSPSRTKPLNDTLPRTPRLPSLEAPMVPTMPYQGFEAPAAPMFLPGLGGEAGQCCEGAP